MLAFREKLARFLGKIEQDGIAIERDRAAIIYSGDLAVGIYGEIFRRELLASRDDALAVLRMRSVIVLPPTSRAQRAPLLSKQRPPKWSHRPPRRNPFHGSRCRMTLSAPPCSLPETRLLS